MSDTPNLSHERLSRPPLHSKSDYRMTHRLRTAIAMVLTFMLTLVLILGGSGAYVYFSLSNKMEGNSLKVTSNSGVKTTIVDPNDGKPLDILIIGQDTRSGAGNAAIGGNDPADADNHQSDTMMVAHISADRKFVDVVSMPRDSIVDVPSCSTDDYSIPARYEVMLNSVFPTAYAASNDEGVASSCLMKTVNSLTGLDIQQFVLVDFAGMSKMIDAIGGVDVCISQDLKDTYTNLDMKRGLQHLDGVTGTQYARVRHGDGTDGSDIMRTVRQQHLIKALFNKMKSNDVLTNPSRLYSLANAALDSVKMSDGLAGMTTLAGLAYSLRKINTDSIYTMTVPTVPYVKDPNRVQWPDTADSLWQRVLSDKPLDPSKLTDGQSATSDGNNADNSTGPQSTTDANGSGANGQTPAPAVDPNTGLSTDVNGNLIDPTTGGIVNNDNGTITDPNNGSIIGFAEQYVNYTFCQAKK